MESYLTEARDFYACGLFNRSQKNIHELETNPSCPKWDALFLQDLSVLKLQCELASNPDAWDSLDAQTLSPHQQIVAYCSVALGSRSTDAARAAAFTALTQLLTEKKEQLDANAKALGAFTLNALTSTGNHIQDSSELGSLNSAIASVMAPNSPASVLYEIILLLLGDRPDLALKVHERTLLSSEDSVVPQLMQTWMALIKGFYQEAFLSVQDVESMLATDTGDSSSWRLGCLKGLAKLHNRQFQEASDLLENAASLSAFKEPAPLVSLIACYQNMGRREEAAKLTEILNQYAPSCALSQAGVLNDLKEQCARYP
eukprot:Protomagalhaensia_sp_Gyna_25__2602@NODE_2480_length_1062_cov_111_808407_g2053_i0_p1_GENE_NODE_2480_length_1062_cov_111_808407_g2053_i0NODE_2480_length_1062_cov_111_808407_g2053_i0_p1_ORF_typecomplete_len315_score59_32Coatomer_E/PF04733_14/6e19PknG_TPR/PF16918_5/22PknG_TPR/PF16918_5/0_0019ANAPC3/PF12895_7/0_003TPR_15/PF13429_6/0_017TPR_19/PF14559_6/2_7e03TPR_19/PF14559_6/3e03TPR_19/PF14559_6/0_005FADSLDH/PF12318_8/0_044FADSLDH/PF12318_8/8_1e03RPN7/PF10602_9/3_4e03RPN7/PF10602_9/0_18_NODE_2480_len